jgi:hypothetical protein
LPEGEEYEVRLPAQPTEHHVRQQTQAKDCAEYEPRPDPEFPGADGDHTQEEGDAADYQALLGVGGILTR